MGELSVVCGDLNKHVGDFITGNNSKVSFGGSLLRNFLESNPYVLLNNHENAIGGPFTRYDPFVPNNEDSKSCLDLVIVSA